MYMGIFGSGSPKRHRLFSNDEGWIQELINKAGYMSREDQQKCETKTSRQYIDSSGKKRCVGVKSALKESAHPSRTNLDFSGLTQSPNFIFMMA